MNIIPASTKISFILKANPKAIDVVDSINPHFRILQSPFLGMFLAPKVTIAKAARTKQSVLSGFFEKLKSPGFIIDYGIMENERKQETSPDSIHFDMELDFRNYISSGKDPSKMIIAAVADLLEGKVLLLINSSEPVPLIRILTEKNFKICTQAISPDTFHTYIERTPETMVIP